MPATVSACVIVDTSASMTQYGYVAVTKIDSKAFISYALPNDAIGVVNYDYSAANAYPPNGGMATVDASLTQPIAAAQVVQNLNFNGSATAIGLGIQTAYSALGGSGLPSPRAAVLLSDGYQNHGVDPLSLPTTYPIYTCAMGPNSDQNLLQQIATRTGGVFYYMPYPVNMMQIYNQIRARQPAIQNVVNYLGGLNSQQTTQLLPAVIGTNQTQQQIGVVWSDSTYVYSGQPNPSGNNLYIALYDPTGTKVTTGPAIVGTGFVVFNLPTPMAGTWNVYSQYPGSSSALYLTTGVFEFPSNAAAAIRLDVDAPVTQKAGQPLAVNAQVFDGDEPVKVDSMQVEVVSPKLSVKNALAKYSGELKALSLSAADADGYPDEARARLALFARLQGPGVDVVSHRQVEAPMMKAKDGRHGFVVTDTAQAGGYNAIVKVTGFSPKSKTAFQRTRLVSVPVLD
jgi:hypothetical protein